MPERWPASKSHYDSPGLLVYLSMKSSISTVAPRRDSLRRLLCFITLLPLLLLGGCAVSFVSGYDRITDEGIQEVTKKTETIISDVLVNKTGFASHRENYRQAQGALAAVGLRAEYYGEKNKAEREIIGKLQQALANLEEIHRLVGSFRPAEAEGVRSLLRTLMHHELSKKNSAAFSKPEAGR